MPIIYATIRASAARAADWERVLGGHRVPIKSPVPHRAPLSAGEPRQCYELALDQLTLAQRERLAELLAERCELPLEDVHAELRRNGYVPVLADDVMVSIDARCIL